MTKKIVITSGKGGVGKTTLTANLGLALAKMGFSVLLVDADFGLNNLDVVMNLESKITYDLSDVLEGRCRTKQALVQDRIRKNLYVLPSNSLNSGSGVSGQNLKLVVENVSPLFDYVLLDCPAGIDLGFHRAVSCCDNAIVVTTPQMSCIRDADKVISILKSYKLDSVSLVVNRARGDLVVGDKMMSPLDVEALLDTDLIGVLPEEDVIFLSGGYALPMHSDSYKGYKILANNIVKGKKKIFDVTNKYLGFFGSIRRSIKRSI
ncbi:MAG: septum site-determining protein MinD [Clostridiales bacterium]|nr:septum site-determining protein MinD [Clostridiales bacterium]